MTETDGLWGKYSLEKHLKTMETTIKHLVQRMNEFTGEIIKLMNQHEVLREMIDVELENKQGREE